MFCHFFYISIVFKTMQSFLYDCILFKYYIFGEWPILKIAFLQRLIKKTGKFMNPLVRHFLKNKMVSGDKKYRNQTAFKKITERWIPQSHIFQFYIDWKDNDTALIVVSDPCWKNDWSTNLQPPRQSSFIHPPEAFGEMFRNFALGNLLFINFYILLQLHYLKFLCS